MQYTDIEQVRTAREFQLMELEAATEQYCAFLREQLEQLPARRLQIAREACEAGLENDPEGLRTMAQALRGTEEDRMDAEARLKEAEAFLRTLSREALQTAMKDHGSTDDMTVLVVYVQERE